MRLDGNPVLLTAELRAGPGRFVKIGGVESDSLINGLRSGVSPFSLMPHGSF
jgi:hypothetical protein